MVEAALWIMVTSSIAFLLLALAGFRLLTSVLEEAEQERTVGAAHPSGESGETTTEEASEAA